MRSISAPSGNQSRNRVNNERCWSADPVQRKRAMTALARSVGARALMNVRQAFLVLNLSATGRDPRGPSATDIQGASCSIRTAG